MATSVPLIAQVPISAPTASRMKIAGSPVVTLATAASRRSAIEWPCRQATKVATIAQKTSATWFGPAGGGVAEEEERQSEQPDERHDRDERRREAEGFGCVGPVRQLSAPLGDLRGRCRPGRVPASRQRRPQGSGYFSSSSFMISAFLVAASASEARI